MELPTVPQTDGGRDHEYNQAQGGTPRKDETGDPSRALSICSSLHGQFSSLSATSSHPAERSLHPLTKHTPMRVFSCGQHGERTPAESASVHGALCTGAYPALAAETRARQLDGCQRLLVRRVRHGPFSAAVSEACVQRGKVGKKGENGGKVSVLGGCAREGKSQK